MPDALEHAVTVWPIYAAQWPILDDSRRQSELIAEALPDLHRMMRTAGVIPMGDTDWQPSECAGQPFLNARTPVRHRRRRRAAR